MKQGQGYDAIAMHPPFITERNPLEYADHFHHAYGMLSEGGMLVGVAPASLVFSEDGKVKGLRSLIHTNSGNIQHLSSKMFKVKDEYVATVLVDVRRKI